MDFPRIDAALKSCREHLDATASRNSEIELFLVNYVLGVIYAEYEQAIRFVIVGRSQTGADAHHDAFVAVAVKRITRSFRLSELCGYLNYFDGTCKKDFLGKVENSQYHSAWDSLMHSRMDFAHASGAQLTLDEVEGYYANSKVVLEAFEAAIGIGKP